MLLGIIDKDEFLEDLDQDACDDKIWVELDDPSGPTVHKTFMVPDFKFGGLKAHLKRLFQALKKNNADEMRMSVYCVSDSELDLSKEIGKFLSCK